MKKKRSAKQLANDKKLGRMAKARAALARKNNPKRKKRRKVAKRKPRRKNTLRARQTAMQRATNPKRKKLAKSHLWFVFKCDGPKVTFLAIGKQPWRTAKGDGVFFRTKSRAESAARLMAGKRAYSRYFIGVADAATTAATIIRFCRGKA